MSDGDSGPPGNSFHQRECLSHIVQSCRPAAARALCTSKLDVPDGPPRRGQIAGERVHESKVVPRPPPTSMDQYRDALCEALRTPDLDELIRIRAVGNGVRSSAHQSPVNAAR